MLGLSLILTFAAATLSVTFPYLLAARNSATKVLATSNDARWLGHIN